MYCLWIVFLYKVYRRQLGASAPGAVPVPWLQTLPFCFSSLKV